MYYNYRHLCHGSLTRPAFRNWTRYMEYLEHGDRCRRCPALICGTNRSPKRRSECLLCRLILCLQLTCRLISSQVVSTSHSYPTGHECENRPDHCVVSLSKAIYPAFSSRLSCTCINQLRLYKLKGESSVTSLFTFCFINIHFQVEKETK